MVVSPQFQYAPGQLPPLDSMPAYAQAQGGGSGASDVSGYVYMDNNTRSGVESHGIDGQQGLYDQVTHQAAFADFELAIAAPVPIPGSSHYAQEQEEGSEEGGEQQPHYHDRSTEY